MHAHAAAGSRQPSRAVLIGFSDAFQGSLERVLRAGRGFSAVTGVESGEAAARLLAREAPDLAVVCNERVDLVALSRLASRHPQTGFVVVAKKLLPSRRRALEACGAAAILERAIDPSLFLLIAVAVANGVRGGLYLPPRADVERPRVASAAALSDRESLVLELLREHRSLGEIAEALGVTRPTVSSQAQSIYRKLGVRSRRQLRDRLAPRDRAASAGRDREPERLRGLGTALGVLPRPR